MKLLSAFTLIIVFHNILHTSQEHSQSKLAMPFKLLLNPDYKNNIIICGIKINQNADPNPEHNLFILAKNGIIAHQKEIQEKDLKIAVFSKCMPQDNDFWSEIRKRENKEEYRSLYGSKDQNQAQYVIYNMSSYDHQESFYHIYQKISNPSEISYLVLVDETLLQQYDIHNEIYDHFAGKKKISICDPYAGTIEEYRPNDRSLCRLMQYTYLFAIGLLLAAHYYDPEIGTHILDAFKYASLT